MKGKILIVDDEFHQRRILKEAATAFGYEAADTGDPEEALKLSRFGRFDLVLTDLQMPKMDGIKLLQSLRIHDPGVSVVVVTGQGTIQTAVEAMKKGAEDYVLKPVELPALELMLEKVFQKRALVKANQMLTSENALLKKELKVRYHLGSMIGRSDRAKILNLQVEQVLKNRAPLLILGEEGTGRGDMARMIHYNSPWAPQSLLLFDAASVPAELREIQLFGEEAKVGSNLTALDHPGLVEKAHLGTLVIFHPELLSETTQVRLNRVMTEEKAQRVGGQRFRAASCRVIVISHPQEYDRQLAAGKIQAEFARTLGTNQILIPALNERREDIPVLALIATKQYELGLGRKVEKIAPDAVEYLKQADYPGNVRELNERVKAAMGQGTGPVLELKDFQR